MAMFKKDKKDKTEKDAPQDEEVENGEAAHETTEAESEKTTASAENSDGAASALARRNPLENLLPIDIVSEEHRPAVAALLAEMNPVKRGFTDEASRDWAPTEIRVRQALSRNVPDNIKNGELYTTVGDKVPAPFRFTPLFISKSNIKFEVGGGSKIECMSLDTITSRFGTKCADCPDLPFRNGVPTQCNSVLNAIVLAEDLKLYVIRFSKTSYKAGAQLSKMAQKTGAPWAKWYDLDTSEETNQNKTKYHVLRTNPSGQDVPADIQVIGDRLNLVVEELHQRVLARAAEQVVSAQLETEKLESETPVEDSDVVEPDFSETV